MEPDSSRVNDGRREETTDNFGTRQRSYLPCLIMGATLTSPHKTISFTEDPQPPAAKRARFDPDLDRETNQSVHYCTSDATNVKSRLNQFFVYPSSNIAWHMPTRFCSKSQQPRWERLPYVALVEIFQHLTNNDKYNAALACRAWQLVFHRPALWRRGNFQFNGVDEWRALSFVSMMGVALRHVNIDCSAAAPGVRAGWASMSAENLSIFLTCLVNSNNRQVTTFGLSHLRRLVKHLDGPECDVMPLLTKFLAAQETLTSLNLEHAGLSADDAFQLLMCAADSSATSVRSLSISEVICPTPYYDVASDPRLLTLLARFTALTELSISHRYLSDDLLFLLASTLVLTLTQISVWAGYVARVETWRTSPRAWKHLAIRCPALSTSFTVKGKLREQGVTEVLVPGTPLTRLNLDIGGFTTRINIESCLQHIVRHFHKSLRHLVLDLQMAAEDVEDDLASFVEQCASLESLHLTSSLSDIQELRLKRKVRRAVSRQSRSRLKDVTFNGDEVDLEMNWTNVVLDWLSEHLQ